MSKVYGVIVEGSRPANGVKPSAGAAYRYIYAIDGLTDSPPGFDSPWDFFSKSVNRNPKNPMLGHRQLIDGKICRRLGEGETREEEMEVGVEGKMEADEAR